jgi:hypothetical protein
VHRPARCGAVHVPRSSINGIPVANGGLSNALPTINTSTTLTLVITPAPELLDEWGATFELTLTRDSTEGFGMGIGFEEDQVPSP